MYIGRRKRIEDKIGKAKALGGKAMGFLKKMKGKKA